MSEPTLYGFDGSTYVRTVRMLLAEKDVRYEQVPVDVLEGEPKEPEHLDRHPFGKVPVLDHDGHRILETNAIARYVDEVFDGPSFVPGTAPDRARMNTTIGFVDSYGYGSLIGGVAAYHLFPAFVGGKDDRARHDGVENGRKCLDYLMKLRGDSAFIAGDERSIADFYLAPICAYVGMTEDAESVFDVPGFDDWWSRMQGLDSFTATAPDAG